MTSAFSDLLEHWYADHGRDLPWRHTRDPYLIMLSELILQQTQVSQGMDYYLRFARRYPTAEHLAAASEEDVLLLWQGLGYYSRARHLHAAAKQVAQAGSFPRDYASVRALPGVGDYTAAAIMSFAFDEPYAVLDGNVQRVLARHFGIDEPVDTTRGKKLLRALADEMLDRRRPALYNQAIMDFGALLCKPVSPLCSTCPLQDTCHALREHSVDRLPAKSKRTAVRDRYLTYIYVRTRDGHTLLHRRGSGDIWQGLFEFPLIESEKPLTMAEVEQRLSAKGALTLIASDVRHQLTHQRLHADLYLLALPQVNDELAKAPESQTINGQQSMVNGQWSIINGQWVKESDLDRYALPRLLEKLLERLERE
ncbi:MAG: A/G-specific adenine glycosylase [Oscillospiraceae bacterium]|nr:A/G-specific adenine glycosylase [Oscillospiraceae bacterium]